MCALVRYSIVCVCVWCSLSTTKDRKLYPVLIEKKPGSNLPTERLYVFLGRSTGCLELFFQNRMQPSTIRILTIAPWQKRSSLQTAKHSCPYRTPARLGVLRSECTRKSTDVPALLKGKREYFDKNTSHIGLLKVPRRLGIAMGSSKNNTPGGKNYCIRCV